MTTHMRLVLAVAMIAAWIGAAVLVASSVAPSAFAVLPTRTMAGDVVGRVLPVIFTTGLVVGLVGAWLAGAGPGGRWRAALGLAVAVACGIAQFVIGPRIARLRDTIGGAIDSLPVDDVQRIAFGRLHGISVMWMGVAVIAASALLVLTMLALRPRS